MNDEQEKRDKEGNNKEMVREVILVIGTLFSFTKHLALLSHPMSSTLMYLPVMPA